jgi:hypothetical protein
MHGDVEPGLDAHVPRRMVQHLQSNATSTTLIGATHRTVVLTGLQGWMKRRVSGTFSCSGTSDMGANYPSGFNFGANAGTLRA